MVDGERIARSGARPGARSRGRLLVVPVALALLLVSAACGARWSDEEREAVFARTGQGGSGDEASGSGSGSGAGSGSTASTVTGGGVVGGTTGGTGSTTGGTGGGRDRPEAAPPDRCRAPRRRTLLA